MVNLDNIYQYLLSTNGVNQLQRKLPALDPNYVQLDGRTKSDLLNFLFHLSKQISFYDLTNTPAGDWSGFFNFLTSADGTIMSEVEINQLLASRNDWPPHLALLMAFLHIYAIAQQDMNQLVSKHLNYYYKKVLQLAPRIARPDQVHVTFELNKSASVYPIKQGTLLDAGKDTAGQPLRYSIDNDVVINRAVVQSLKSLYFDQQNGHAIAFIANDATLVKSSHSSGWRPFGTSQLALASESRNMVEADLGFAIASPSLLLAEGKRTIKVTLKLNAEGISINNLQSCFALSVTGDKGWVSPLFTEKFKLATTTDPIITLTFKVTLSEKDPPVVAYNAKLHGDGYSTAWPVLRCIYQPYSFQLEALDKFVVSSVDIEVSAEGIKNLVLQNDESLQPVNKPILPFTSFPRIGNNFYIGSTEGFSKSLESVSVLLNWKDPPTNFHTYYLGYDNTQVNVDQFKCNMYILASGAFQIITPNIQNLFDGIPTSNQKIIPAYGSFFESKMQQSGYGREAYLNTVEEYSPTVKQGFISIQLSGPKQGDVGDLPSYAPFEAFGHKVFPTIYAVKAIKLAKNTATVPAITLPNQAYTPTLQSVSLDYKAKETFIPSIQNGIDQFFILDAFGNVECNANVPPRLIPELPVSIASLSGNQAGILYIGIDKVQPPQIMSLLFQMESGSMPGSALLQKNNLAWSYLKNNEWQPFASSDIQLDTTELFQKPGIIRVSVASDADLEVTIMPTGLCWLRVTALQNAEGASDISAIVAQAASATRIAGGGAVISKLKPGTITRLVTKVSEIKTVTQSYPSFNGLPAESESDFYVRTSERLRHRNRTIVGWDYERIILQKFTGLFKAKCLSNTDEFNNLAPGCIKLVVIPDMRQGNAGNLLKPISNLAYLDEIKQFVIENNPSPFLDSKKISVSNPVYETLLVDCKISFVTGYDPSYYSNQLQDDIRHFLSPWAYDEGQDITFGGKIHASEIVSFIEGRPYVDYIINFKLYHRSPGKDFTAGIGCMKIGVDFIVGIKPSGTIASTNGYTYTGTKIGVDFVVGIPVDVATATRPDAILASNISHRIVTLQAGSFECSGVSTIGIGEMIVGLDFIPI